MNRAGRVDRLGSESSGFPCRARRDGCPFDGRLHLGERRGAVGHRADPDAHLAGDAVDTAEHDRDHRERKVAGAQGELLEG